MDDFGETAAGGGIAGVALGVAANNERESGVQALRAIGSSANRRGSPPRSQFMPEERGFGTDPNDSPYTPPRPRSTRGLQPQDSYSSTLPLGGAAGSPGMATPEGALTPRLHPDDISRGSYPSQDHHLGDGLYGESPYNRHSAIWDPRVSQSNLGGIDPATIADDGDDYAHGPGPRRTAVNPGTGYGAPAALAGGAAAGGLFGRLLGKKTASTNFSPDQYGPVPGEGMGDDGHQKSEWLAQESTSKKKLRTCVGILALILVVGIIVGAIVGGIIGARNSSSPSGPKGAPSDDAKGDLNKNSAEIQKLMSNPKLHKVFPGIDYTPINTQYPGCLTLKPIQNNITRDMAVLSLLTNQVRLYGTDCNQTEMVLHSVQALGLTDMKIWLGVWLEGNDTTNSRQLSQMYNILDANGGDPFAGIIIGNEVLYRKDLTETQLSTIITDTKTNLTSKNIKLPVATSDLGDNWTKSLAEVVDIVMSNVHPFFAGVTAEIAASWAWDFWQQNDVILTNEVPNAPKQVISEIGWPSAGGNDCGSSTCTTTTTGSVAGTDEMNTFMNNFVCQSLANGTQYFW
jgi:exo-beta-1,3-glucanase (GH17 family)